MATTPHRRDQRSRPGSMPAPRRRRRPAVLAAAVAAAITRPVGASDVQANLWEWGWPSIARERTTTLGPAGYGGVQVAPPANSLSRTGPDAETGGPGGVVHPWWEVYQPATYELTSRLGTEQQLATVVATCRAAGVKVYVDAVINHMTGQGTTSSTGAGYEHTSHPTSAGAALGSLYGPGDFHARGTGVDRCPSASGGIEDFNDERQVLRCELVGLADLRTEDPAVRGRIVGYLDGLIALGVSGFRVDAAKHIGNADLRAIRDALHDTADGTRPQWALEVFPGSPGALSQRAATQVGSVLGFDCAHQIENAFKSYPDGATGNITSLRVLGEDAGFVPSDKSLVFVQDHDTERGQDTLGYRDGDTNPIADQLMLAHPYGTPQVYSAFALRRAGRRDRPAGLQPRVRGLLRGQQRRDADDHDPADRSAAGYVLRHRRRRAPRGALRPGPRHRRARQDRAGHRGREVLPGPAGRGAPVPPEGPAHRRPAVRRCPSRPRGAAVRAGRACAA